MLNYVLLWVNGLRSLLPEIIKTSSFPLILFWCAISFLAMPIYVRIAMIVRVAIDASPVTQLMIANQKHSAGLSPVLAKSAVL